LVSLPEMRKYRYSPALATGSIAAGGTIGSLIPPSGMLIVLGLLTELSISKLFLAGLVPGILEAIFYMATIFLLCSWRPALGPPGRRYSWAERFSSLKVVGEVVLLMALVLGGLVGGLFTPTEAGAVGASGALAFALIRKRLTVAKFKAAIVATLKTTGFLYAIFIGAFMMTSFMTATGIPAAISESIVELDVAPLLAILAIFLIYLLLGAVLDTTGMMALTVPVFFPVAQALGFEGIWFAIIIIRAMEIALITPPIGMAVYLVKSVAPDVPVGTIFRGITPFLAADFLLVMLLLFVPGIITFLPNWLS
ncbi:MAG: TRAP transporter large permease subunit, partial [Chromatiales bacterium]|nr:TRAP transporter large permease subunit [Chromatiales bacterium]